MNVSSMSFDTPMLRRNMRLNQGREYFHMKELKVRKRETWGTELKWW